MMDPEPHEMSDIKKVTSRNKFDEINPYNILSEEERDIYMAISNEDFINYKELFEVFDESGDGAIDQDEIGQLMQALGQNPT